MINMFLFFFGCIEVFWYGYVYYVLVVVFYWNCLCGFFFVYVVMLFVSFVIVILVFFEMWKFFCFSGLLVF